MGWDGRGEMVRTKPGKMHGLGRTGWDGRVGTDGLGRTGRSGVGGAEWGMDRTRGGVVIRQYIVRCLTYFTTRRQGTKCFYDISTCPGKYILRTEAIN